MALLGFCLTHMHNIYKVPKMQDQEICDITIAQN